MGEATYQEAAPGNLRGQLMEQRGNTRVTADKGARSLAQTCPCAPPRWSHLIAQKQCSSQLRSPTHLPSLAYGICWHSLGKLIDFKVLVVWTAENLTDWVSFSSSRVLHSSPAGLCPCGHLSLEHSPLVSDSMCLDPRDFNWRWIFLQRVFPTLSPPTHLKC